MRKFLFSIIATAFALGIGIAVAQDSLGSFERIKAKTFDGEKIVFPENARGTQLNIFFLAMSTDQDNGQLQQDALLDWYVALAERGVFSEAVMPYHFPVPEGVPFFVKGIVAGAMRDSYEGKVPLDQAGVLFTKDVAAFAESAGLPLDEQATIVIATADAVPLEFFKGEVSPEGVNAIVAAIERLQ